MSSWSEGYVSDLGYTYGFYRELTPALLSTVALTAGLRAPDANMPLNYCELGCGQGVSINLLAAANPLIQFYATDFNPAHIVGAQALARDAATTNVHFFDQSFSEFIEEPSLPEFDIISLHGIYSWVNEENRRTIVEFVRKKLKVGGLLYISYNSLPGWAAMAPIRHLMYLHGKATGGPTALRMRPALDFVNKVITSDAMYAVANPNVKPKFEAMNKQNPNYLAHEYMNDAWTLLYHSDVVRELSDAKVTFVGSAALLERLDSLNLKPEQQTILAEISDPVLKETVRDFMTNRQFRRDVFVKGSVPLKPVEGQQAWANKRVALNVARSDVPLVVACALGEANLQPEIYNPVLDYLASGPKALRELFSNSVFAGGDWVKLPAAINVLIGAGKLEPALDVKDDSKRAARTRVFNNAVMKRAENSAELSFLASPVTGGAVQVGRIEQLLLAARGNKQTDTAYQVWNIINGRGERMVKDGKLLQSAEENLAEIKRIRDLFESKRLPVLQQLGIA